MSITCASDNGKISNEPMSSMRGTYTAICAVLESDGEGDAARKLTVQLRLGRACANGAPGDEVGDVLRRDGVEQLGADGDAEVREVAEQLARDAQALVDFEGAVDVGVVDQTFPADSRPWFLRANGVRWLTSREKNGSQVEMYLFTSLEKDIGACERDVNGRESRRRRTSKHA